MPRWLPNLWAIVLTIRALRQIDRAGASDMLDRAFTGFQALPAPTVEWWQVLGVEPDVADVIIRARYRELVKQHHPDAGGDRIQFERIQNAWQQYRQLNGAQA